MQQMGGKYDKVLHMKDNFLRRVIKRIATLFYLTDLAIHRARWRFKGNRPYTLTGKCTNCGACCKEPAIWVDGFLWYFSIPQKLFLAWQLHVNGLEFLGKDISRRSFVFRCKHLDPETLQCDCYSSRPGMCRDYPRIHLYGHKPEFFPSCSFRPVSPWNEVLIDNLKQYGVTEEQIDRIKTDLVPEPPPEPPPEADAGEAETTTTDQPSG